MRANCLRVTDKDGRGSLKVARTNTEIIRDLEKSVATLIERLANVRAEQARLEAVLQRTVDNAGRLETRLALLEEKVSDLRKWREERDRKNWLLIVALVGSILTFIGNVAIVLIRG